MFKDYLFHFKFLLDFFEIDQKKQSDVMEKTNCYPIEPSSKHICHVLALVKKTAPKTECVIPALLYKELASEHGCRSIMLQGCLQAAAP